MEDVKVLGGKYKIEQKKKNPPVYLGLHCLNWKTSTEQFIPYSFNNLVMSHFL